MQAGERNVRSNTSGFNQGHRSKMESYEEPADCYPPLASALRPQKNGERQWWAGDAHLGTEH